MKKIAMTAMIILGLCLYSSLIQAKDPDEGEWVESIWKQILNPNELITVREFIEGRYISALSCKMSEFLKRQEGNELLPLVKEKINDKSIFRIIDGRPEGERRFAYIATFLAEVENDRIINQRIAERAERSLITGQSSKYKLVSRENRLNDALLNRLNKALEKKTILLGGKMRIIHAFYETHSNTMAFDPRLKLPPALWLVVFYEEATHAYYDIVVHGNNPPTDPQSRIDMELQGIIAGFSVWQVIKEDFMRAWLNQKLQQWPEFIIASRMIVQLKQIEKLFPDYISRKNQTPLRELVRTAHLL